MTRAHNNRSSRARRAPVQGRRSARGPGDTHVFIAVGDPADFQTPENRTTVRSRAMKWHKSQAPITSGDDTTASPSPGPVVTPSFSPSPLLVPVFVTETGQQNGALDNFESSGGLGDYQTYGDDLQPVAPAVRLPNGHTVGADGFAPPMGNITGYEPTAHHQQLMVQLLISMFDPQHRFGDADNALIAMFKFRNPIISADYFLREFISLFGTTAMMRKWPGIMARRHDLMLSSTLLATLWNDVHNVSRSDILLTAAVKEEVRDLVQEALHRSPPDHNDATLMALLHLFVGEMWSTEQESASSEYEKLVVYFVNCRRGIHHLHADLQEVVIAYCYHWAITSEEKPTDIFNTWSPPPLLNDMNVALPESPLFRRTANLETVRRDPRCSITTAMILKWMCDLTDLFIEGNSDTTTTPDIKLEDQGRGSQRLIHFHYKANEIREHLTSLESACKPGHQASNDWVYEACRVVALIYVTALIDRSSFSMAARSSRFVSASSSASIVDIQADSQGSGPSPIEALVEVLENTMITNIWGDMAGVFYWVCAVGAAAARTPRTTDGLYWPSLSKQRQYLDMHAARAMIILIYEHPTPMIMAQTKLLRVQSILGSHDSKPDDH